MARRYSLDDGYADLEAAWRLPPAEVFHEVIAISGLLRDHEVAEADIASWSETAAAGILALGIPGGHMIHPYPLDRSRAALVFTATDDEMLAFDGGAPLPSLLEVRFGRADIDWATQPPRAWGHLRTLRVTSAAKGQNLYPWLSRQVMPDLRDFIAGSAGMAGDDLRRLLGSGYWPSLDTIVLSGNDLGPGEFPWPAKLAARTIRFDYAEADEVALASMLRSSLPELRELDVSGNPTGLPGLSTTVDAALPCLQRLSMRGNGISRDQIWGLLAAASWPQLDHLDISGDGSDPDNLLLAGGLLSSLASLNLASSGLGDAGVSALLSLPFRRLASLSIAYNAIGLDGARALARAELPDLVELELSVNTFGDDGARALSEAAWWPRIRSLSMVNVGLTDAGLDILAATPPASVRRIDVGTSRFSDASVARLRAALPHGARLG